MLFQFFKGFLAATVSAKGPGPTWGRHCENPEVQGNLPSSLAPCCNPHEFQLWLWDKLLVAISLLVFHCLRAQRFRRQVFSNGKCRSAAHASAGEFCQCSSQLLWFLCGTIVLGWKPAGGCRKNRTVSIRSISIYPEFVTYLRILGESWGIINFLKWSA